MRLCVRMLMWVGGCGPVVGGRRWFQCMWSAFLLRVVYEKCPTNKVDWSTGHQGMTFSQCCGSHDSAIPACKARWWCKCKLHVCAWDCLTWFWHLNCNPQVTNHRPSAILVISVWEKKRSSLLLRSFPLKREVCVGGAGALHWCCKIRLVRSVCRQPLKRTRGGRERRGREWGDVWQGAAQAAGPTIATGSERGKGFSPAGRLANSLGLWQDTQGTAPF